MVGARRGTCIGSLREENWSGVTDSLRILRHAFAAVSAACPWFECAFLPASWRGAEGLHDGKCVGPLPWALSGPARRAVGLHEGKCVGPLQWALSGPALYETNSVFVVIIIITIIVIINSWVRVLVVVAIAIGISIIDSHGALR